MRNINKSKWNNLKTIYLCNFILTKSNAMLMTKWSVSYVNKIGVPKINYYS